jgi:hypothetical protein
MLSNSSELGLDGGALMMAFRNGGDSFFGPALPVACGVLLVVVGVGVMTRSRRLSAWASPVGAVAALLSLGAVCVTAPVQASSARIGGAGIEIWLVASLAAAGALGIGIANVRCSPQGLVLRRVLRWTMIPCFFAFFPLLGATVGLDEQSPFPETAVFAVYTLMSGFPAVGTTIALLLVSRHDRSRADVAVGTIGLILGGLWLLVMFAVAASSPQS